MARTGNFLCFPFSTNLELPSLVSDGWAGLSFKDFLQFLALWITSDVLGTAIKVLPMGRKCRWGFLISNDERKPYSAGHACHQSQSRQRDRRERMVSRD